MGFSEALNIESHISGFSIEHHDVIIRYESLVYDIVVVCMFFLLFCFDKRCVYVLT